jgi:hypothetical protein
VDARHEAGHDVESVGRYRSSFTVARARFR